MLFAQGVDSKTGNRRITITEFHADALSRKQPGESLASFSSVSPCLTFL